MEVSGFRGQGQGWGHFFHTDTRLLSRQTTHETRHTLSGLSRHPSHWRALEGAKPQTPPVGPHPYQLEANLLLTRN